MGLFKKVKKESTTPKHIEGKITQNKEAREEIHYMKGNLKDFKKQLKTKESIVLKNDAYVILHSGPKNQQSFLSEFEKLTREGYMLTGISETKGLPLTVLGFNIKTGKLFFFQHMKWFSKA